MERLQDFVSISPRDLWIITVMRDVLMELVHTHMISLGSILRLINYVFRMVHRERDYVERSFLIKKVMNMINNLIYFYCVLL